MKPLYFAALLAVAAADMIKMVKTGERKRVVAAYVLLMLLAAGVGAVALYTDIRILE